MKNKGLLFALCTGCLLMMTACGSSAGQSTAASAAASVKPLPATSASTAVSSASTPASSAASTETASAASTAASSAAASTASAAASKTIKPLDTTLDLNALDDSTFAVSFKASDVSSDSADGTKIHLTVWDYERYDMVDISTLAVGDTISVNKKDVVVKKMDASGSDIVINGGKEAGGFTLHTDEDGVYYVYDEESGPDYYELGDVTLPVGQDFVYTDNSDPQNQGKQMQLKDFLSAMQKGDVTFEASSASVRTDGGKIAELKKIYMP